MSLLFEILDALVLNPDAFPGRVRAISLDGRVQALFPSFTAAASDLRSRYSSSSLESLLHFVAPKLQVTKPVLFSYSDKDGASGRRSSSSSCGPLKNRNLSEFGMTLKYAPAQTGLAEGRNALGSARVAVFLVT